MSNYDNWKTSPNVNAAYDYAQGILDAITYDQMLKELDERGMVWDEQPTRKEAEDVLFDILVGEYYREDGGL